jgi:hypothetical protein
MLQSSAVFRSHGISAIFSQEEPTMKAIEKLSTTSTGIRTVEFGAKKFRLTLIFGASLIFIGSSLHAEDRQGAEAVLAPPTGLRIATQEPPEKINENSNPGKWEGTRPHRKRDSIPGNETPRRGTDLDREETDRGSAPDRENINKDTTGPGGDNMLRDAIPGGSGLKRE